MLGALVGLTELAQVLLARAPQAVVDEDTRRVLEDAAAGRLPPIA